MVDREDFAVDSGVEVIAYLDSASSPDSHSVEADVAT